MRNEPRDCRGSMLMETVLAMPILLLLIFGLIQFAHIWTARQMVAYAAFCATRAIMVTRSAETGGTTFEDSDETGVDESIDEQHFFAQQAAEVALSWINLADAGRKDEVSVPGWGAVIGSGSSEGGPRVTAEILSRGYGSDDDNYPPCAAVRVRFLFPLMIPGMAVNKIIATAVQSSSVIAPTGDFYADLDKAAGSPTLIDGWPYIALEETCVLPMPYSTRSFPLRAAQTRGADEYDYARIDIRREVNR